MSTSDEKPLVLTRAQVREVDRRAIEEFGIPGIVLMENAGRNAAALIAEWSKPGDQIAIVCGPGNNGGDGFVIARHLLNAGFDVRVYIICEDASKLRGDALINFRIIERMKVRGYFVDDDRLQDDLAEFLRSADLIVDAILGTGFSGELRARMHFAIGNVYCLRRPVVAIDVPSGMDCDTGRTPGPGMMAWRTITFVAMKPGFLVPGAGAITGEVFVADIGAPARLIQDIATSAG